jgi:hypothetical protein
MRFLYFLFALMAAATVASAAVTPLPGSSPQTARAHVPFLNQIGVVVTDASGAPVQGATVRFSFGSAFLGPHIDADNRAFDCFPDAGWNCRTTTDAQGIAILPGMYGSVPLRSSVRVFANLGTVELGSATIELESFGSWTTPFKSLQDMWWSGVAENGWGMSVVEHGAQLFSVIYAYDAEGNPTWWVMPTGTWNSGFFMTSYLGNLYSPRSAPYFAYDVSRFAPGAPAGTAELTFSGPDVASLGLNIGGVGMRKQLQRMTDIGTDSTESNHGVGDMWWGGAAQSGWGVSIIERNGVLFSVWLTYGADGKPTWFVMPGGTWTDRNTYTGPIIRTHSSAWVGVNYNAGAFDAAVTGRYTLRFANAHNATLEYSIDGRSGTLSLVRQRF